LPLAHSDANVSGSIVLASIVLKLALYGFLRILIGIFLLATARLTPFFLSVCTLSLLYSSFTTIRQFDLKVLVAYSSIAHMGSTLLGTFSNQISGLVGSVMFGLAHGFVSPGLFIGVGAVLYDRCGSRVINYYRGISSLLPLFSLFFLILIFGNMGVPLTANFVGEFMSLIASYQQNVFITSLAALGIILSAVYSIYMYNRVSSGSFSPYLHTLPDLFRKEYVLLVVLIFATIILGIYPTVISSEIEYGLSSLLYFCFFPVVTLEKGLFLKKVIS
jgi:NADH-ubiquinone oxidoreductase chain 4